MQIQKRPNDIWIHIMVCVVLVVIPFTLQIESDTLNSRFMNRFWLMVFGLLVTFYSNYLFAIDKLLYKKKYILFILFNIGIFAFTDFFELTISALLDSNSIRYHHHRGGGPSGVIQTMYIYNKIIFAALGVGAALAARYSKKLADIEVERERLETEKLTSEISLLKYQMQPHFFFNTLNNIYALISKSPTDAQKAVHSLSKMMRYILYENTSETISLDKEIDFIENYNKLMMMRLNDKVKVELITPDDVEGINIPPLLLIPLIENAYKHGVSYEKESFIHSKMTIDGDMLTFEVQNSICDNGNEDHSNSGIGLQNLRKRMEILFGDEATLETKTENNGNTFHARMTFRITQ